MRLGTLHLLTLYFFIMDTVAPLLTLTKNNLDTLGHLLDKAEEYIATSGTSEAELLAARLAPDMYPFVRQIQVASDDARRNLRLLAGKEHIRMEDTETTLAELKERITKTRAVVDELTPEDFAGADERHVSLYWLGENYVLGKDFVPEIAIPNFLFHVVAAYAILRAKGVPIGKADYITRISMHPAA